MKRKELIGRISKEKHASGITLIALVVTIAVLIILTTISIRVVIGDNGIIGNTKKAKTKVTESQEADNEQARQLIDELSETSTGEQATKPSGWSSSVTAIDDGNGGVVPLPKGFYYVGGDINTGLVISDKKGDKLTASGTGMGNQFVWIPVSGESDLERTNFDTDGKPTNSQPINSMEPNESGYDTEVSEYEAMKTQVLKYGGFYIGRFEAGVNSVTLRTKVTENQTVVCKRGVAPYNYVPWGASELDINTAFVPSDTNPDQVSTNGAVYLAKNMYASSNSVVSTLTYGCQWDAMCRYIGDSQRTTATKDAVELTGSMLRDVSKNIYDLAGNCWEWTMEYEASASTRMARGGYIGETAAIFSRWNPDTYAVYSHFSFRPTLYIK